MTISIQEVCRRERKAERGEYPYHYESPYRPWCGGEEQILADYDVEAICTSKTTVAMDKPLPESLSNWGLVRYRPTGPAEARIA